MNTPNSYELQVEARKWRSRQLALAFAWIGDAAIELVANAFRLLPSRRGGLLRDRHSL
jgi:hypothetical protein